MVAEQLGHSQKYSLVRADGTERRIIFETKELAVRKVAERVRTERIAALGDHNTTPLPITNRMIGSRLTVTL
jgi:hypothetical protein